MTKALKGKRILITGAAGGLGTAAMRQFLAQGALVIGIDRNPAKGDLAEHVLVADVRDGAAVKATVADAIELLGGLDVLVNNAGWLELQDAGMAPTDDVSTAIDINLLGPWRVTAAALPALLASRGRVVNVASLFAVVNAPFVPAYAASKRALVAYSDVLRMQYGDHVGVTTVYPGYMNTAIHEPAVRQGLSVGTIVDFGIFSAQESLESAARGLLGVCSGRVHRDRGLTPLGGLTLWGARHLPWLIDRVVGWRIAQLVRGGKLDVQLGAASTI